jgi:hypothetical protein
MSRRIALVAVAAMCAAVAIGGCEIGRDCPQTLAEAREMTYDDELVAGGYAIRFVPSPDDPEFPGYDVNVTVPISGEAQLNTYFLKVEDPIPGIIDGMPVLLLGERTDRHFVLIPGRACAGLTQVTVEEVGP